MDKQHQQPQYEITGPWIAADTSPNHLELAATAEPGVRAMRSTFWPGNVLFATTGQIRAALEAMETKPELRELVSR